MKDESGFAPQGSGSGGSGVGVACSEDQHAFVDPVSGLLGGGPSPGKSGFWGGGGFPGQRKHPAEHEPGRTLLRVAAELERGVLVVIICDRGDRYLSSGLFGQGGAA